MAVRALEVGGPSARARRVLIGALTAFVLVALFSVGSAHAAFRGTNGKIAFDYQELGDTGDGPGPLTSREIWTQNPDGTGSERLTTNDAADSDPTWSADGRRIAFVSDRSGTSQIWVMDADGSNQRQITHAASGATAPTWSPSGFFIAYASGDDIWAITIFGVFPFRVTRTPGVVESTPAWSPNGQRIAYTAQATGGTLQIWSARFDGRQAVDLSAVAGDAAYDDSQPDWAPDGSGLIYQTSKGHGGGYGGATWRMNADGTDPTQVTRNEYLTGGDQVVLSPDGHAIAQVYYGLDDSGITLSGLGADGMADSSLGYVVQPLGDGYALNPSWQPVRAGR